MPNDLSNSERLTSDKQQAAFRSALLNLLENRDNTPAGFALPPGLLVQDNQVLLQPAGEAITLLQSYGPEHPLVRDLGNPKVHGVFDPDQYRLIVKKLSAGMEPLFNELDLHFMYVIGYLGSQVFEVPRKNRALFALTYAEYMMFLEFFREFYGDQSYSSYYHLRSLGEYDPYVALVDEAQAFLDVHRMQEYTPPHHRQLVLRLVKAYGTFESLLEHIRDDRWV